MVGKLLMLLLVLAVAVIVVKPLREQARPHVQFAIDPVYEWSTRNRVNDIKNLIKAQDQLGRAIPTQRELAAFLDREDVQRNGAVDPWGTPYYLVRTRAGFRVGSAGRDRARNTADDIVSDEAPLNNQPDRRGNRR